MNDEVALQYLATIVSMALQEDLGTGDITTDCLVDSTVQAEGKVIAKQELVTAGYAPFKSVYPQLNPSVICRFRAPKPGIIGTMKQEHKGSGNADSFSEPENTGWRKQNPTI